MRVQLGKSGSNNILRILQKSAISVCREEAAARNSVLYTERMQSFLARYVAEVAKSIASNLSVPVLLDVMPSSIPREREATVSVALRVHGEPIQILIPMELAQELIARVLNEESSRIIERPREDRLAVLAFFVARLLAESEQFLAQRIYVSEVRVIESEENVLQFSDLRNLLELRATLERGEFHSSVRCSERLLERIRAYALISPSTERALRVLEHARVSATLALEFQAKSLLSVISIKPGSVLPLDPASLRGTLSWIHPEGGGAVRYPLRASVAGNKGVLHLEITKKQEDYVCQRPTSHPQ